MGVVAVVMSLREPVRGPLEWRPSSEARNRHLRWALRARQIADVPAPQEKCSES